MSSRELLPGGRTRRDFSLLVGGQLGWTERSANSRCGPARFLLLITASVFAAQNGPFHSPESFPGEVSGPWCCRKCFRNRVVFPSGFHGPLPKTCPELTLAEST